MRRFAAVLAGLLVPAFLLAGAVVNSAMAQEKAAKATATQRVLLENDKVRVYEVTFKPGAENTSVPSSSSRIVRALKGGTIQRTYADGKKENVIYKAGQVRLNEPSPAFTSKNIGKTDIRLYIVMLK
jgi:predicted metal-dependent enzyme (double-stranded beta helix superfamily)